MIEEILKNQSAWEYLKNTDLPIILYGTGNGADRVIDEYERLGIKLSGVMASDGFVRDRYFRGFKVKGVLDFEKEFSDFVITVGFASQREEVIKNILNLSKRHKLLVPCVPAFGETFLNREFIVSHKSELERVYSVLADEKSRLVFSDFLNFSLTGELSYLFANETDKDEAFYNILKLGENESYLDLGAYKGDTVDEFLHYTGGKYSSVKAVEPDKKSFRKLKEHFPDKDNFYFVNCGILDENKTVYFNGKSGRRNAISDSGDETRVCTVDYLCEDFPVTYLKADIEGCENEMLRRCERTFTQLKPKLNIAAYHKSEDIYSIPLKILELNPDYKIYLRHHRYIPCWDLNYYCI